MRAWRGVVALAAAAGTVVLAQGAVLASGFQEARGKLSEMATCSEVRTLTGQTRGVKAVTFSPDPRLPASATKDGTDKLWDASDLTAKQAGRRRWAWFGKRCGRGISCEVVG